MDFGLLRRDGAGHDQDPGFWKFTLNLSGELIDCFRVHIVIHHDNLKAFRPEAIVQFIESCCHDVVVSRRELANGYPEKI
jgi:hypothetical protein